MLAGVSIAAVARIIKNHVATDMDEKESRWRSGSGENVTVDDLGDGSSPRNFMVCTRQLTKHVHAHA